MKIDWIDLGMFAVTAFVGFFIIALVNEKIKYEKTIDSKEKKEVF